MLCVVCSVHWVFYSVLFSTVLFCCGALPQPLFVHFINFLQLKTQVSSLCSVLGAVHALSCRRIGRSRFVQRTTYSFCLQWNIKYTEWMPARQAGIRTQRQKAGRASQQQQQQQRKRRHWQCICICVSFALVCVSVFRSFGTFARYVSLACSLYVRKAEATAQHNAHTLSKLTHVHVHTYVCIWPGRAFIAHFIS